MIYRTFVCLNRHCLHEFTVADTDSPPCPRCTCVHTKWLPKSFAVKSEKTRQADQAVKEVRQAYGDKNYNSPHRYERMEPRYNPIAIKGQTRPYQAPGMQGWGLEVPVDKNGQYFGSYCGTTGVTAKLPVNVGVRQAVSPRSPSETGGVPVFEATHKGRIPL